MVYSTYDPNFEIIFNLNLLEIGPSRWCFMWIFLQLFTEHLRTAKTTQKQDLVLVKYLKIRAINLVKRISIIYAVSIKYEYK